MASLIISDTHFGLDSSTLSNPAKVDQLMLEISEFESGCDEVVLLGDIFDFWRVRPENAVRGSVPFLKRLSRENLMIRYVVGNHDHHLVVQKQEAEFMERAARGDLYPVYIPSLSWRRTFCGLDIEMIYPAYRARCCHRTFLFTHGHHLDGIQNFTLQMVEKLRRLSGEEFLPADLEMMMTYAYEGHLPLRLHRRDGLFRELHLEGLQPAAEGSTPAFFPTSAAPLSRVSMRPY